MTAEITISGRMSPFLQISTFKRNFLAAFFGSRATTGSLCSLAPSVHQRRPSFHYISDPGETRTDRHTDVLTSCTRLQYIVHVSTSNTSRPLLLFFSTFSLQLEPSLTEWILGSSPVFKTINTSMYLMWIHSLTTASKNLTSVLYLFCGCGILQSE